MEERPAADGGRLAGTEILIDVRPDSCNWGARPSRSLCSASRRTVRAVDSIHHVVRQGECRRPVDGTPTGAVETTALPIRQLHRCSQEKPNRHASELTDCINDLKYP